MATLTRDYMPFYLDGRDAKPLRGDFDTEQLAEKVMASGELHATLRTAVTAVAAPLEHDRKRRAWIDDSGDEISAAGGDAAEAYRHYLAGRIDETIAWLEPQVVEEMCELVDEDAGDDDDDDDEPDKD